MKKPQPVFRMNALDATMAGTLSASLDRVCGVDRPANRPRPCQVGDRLYLPVEEGSARMALSEPVLVTLNDELIAAHSGSAGAAVDPFFTNVKSELYDKGFLVATADNLIAWARTGSLMWMQFGLACCAIEMMQMAMPHHEQG
jgi:hypothetical protein